MSTIGSAGFYASTIVGSIAGSRQSETAQDGLKGASAQASSTHNLQQLTREPGEIDETAFSADRDADGHGEWGGQGAPDNSPSEAGPDHTTIARNVLPDEDCGRLLDLEG